jgi:hypothetical protein
MCLDADANRWLDHWTEQQSKEGIDITWVSLKEAFEARFKHYNLSSILKDKWRALRMELNRAGKFVDTFMQLTSQLNLEVGDEQVIHQFKTGLTETARRQVVAAIGSLRLLDSQRQFTVLQLADLVVNQEAEGKLHNTLATTTAPAKPKETRPIANGEPRRICSYCKIPGHDAADCRTKARKEAEASSTTAAAPSSATRAEVDTRTCYNCGKTGHLLRDCKLPRKQNK